MFLDLRTTFFGPGLNGEGIAEANRGTKHRIRAVATEPSITTEVVQPPGGLDPYQYI